MESIVQWLEGLGLGQYGAAFVQADIDPAVLPHLTEADLEKLGVTLGHRKKLIIAIAALSAPFGTSPASPPTAVAAAPEAERRQLTVMFCDLVGSTALSARLDPEDLREIIGRYHACVAETVGRHDGFVAKYMGDGVLVYFGYPHAHEDDTEQAVRAGLALIDAVGELKAPGRLQVRIGIATGLVVVGDLIGAGSAQEQAVVGETPNLAARLQSLAEPDTIVVAESTRRQIGARFEVHDLGPQSVKGFAEPQPAWRVVSENRALGRFEALRSGSTPLVGRDEELDLLLRRWAQAKTGSGRVVLISAEPGVGKSRLAEALAERIAGEPHLRLRYFCSPHHQDSALYPVIAQLERASAFARDDAPEAKLAKLEALLAQSNATDEAIALIASLLSIPTDERYRLPETTPPKHKEKTLAALVAQLAGLAARQPVLVIYEDVHWLDPSTRELLDLAVARTERQPVLLLATFRPEFQPPWTGQPHVTTLALTRLDRHDTAAMVENIAGNHALPDEIVQEIAERTDGVPLFIEELTKAVLESGTQGAATLYATPHPALSVPATLHASLMARLDRLGPTARDVAQTGASIGREFGHELLAAVADLPEPQLGEALDRLTNSGLLFVRGTPPQSTYLFKHALVQDTAYSTLLRGRRQDLHARVAEILEQRFAETVATQPELLAHHFTEAGQAERAANYWLQAGRQALARSTMREAEALVRKGLAVASRLPDEMRRKTRELDLQIALGQALIATQGHAAPMVGDAFDCARQLSGWLKLDDRLLTILLGEWQHHMVRADLERAKEIAAEIYRLGELRNDLIACVWGCTAGGCVCIYLGKFAEARSYLEHGLALFDPSQRASYAALAPEDPLVVLLTLLSFASVYVGYLNQARSRRDAAIAEARRLSSPASLLFALQLGLDAGWTARWDPGEQLRYADEILALSVESGYALWRLQGLAHRGWCLAALGHADEGVPLLAIAVAEWPTTGAIIGLAGFRTMLADAYRVGGNPEAGLSQLAAAERFAEEGRDLSVQAEVLRLRGDLLIVTGDHIAAESSFHDAIALARRQGAKLFELRSAISLARLWRDQGRCVDARDLLAPVYNWFTEGFDAPDLVEAKVLLDDLA